MHRVLDLGCGPGVLAGAFAPLAGEVIAMDPEPEMLRIAEAEFGAVGRISFVRGSSFDLSPALGRFHLVTMGRSFQWMDRVETLRRLDAMIEPGGAVALFNSGHRDAPDTEWIAAYRALVHRYAEDDQTHVKRRAGIWTGHEAILLGSAFSVLDEIAVIERRQVTVPQLVQRALSRSSTTPERLGAAAPRLAAEIEALLAPLATDGMLTEVIATYAMIARVREPSEAEGHDARPMSDPSPAWEARRLLRAARVGTLASCGGRAAVRLPGHAGLRARSVAAAAALRSVRAHAASARRATLFGAGRRGRRQDANPQTTPRVTVTGLAERLVDAALKSRYLAVHPYAAMYADFGDFSLWRIRPLGGLYVGGFARAARLRAADLAPEPAAVAAIEAAEAGIIAHCNADHPDALAAIAGVARRLADGRRSMSMAATWPRASG